jgi:hypothetical protein
MQCNSGLQCKGYVCLLGSQLHSGWRGAGGRSERQLELAIRLTHELLRGMRKARMHSLNIERKCNRCLLELW